MGFKQYVEKFVDGNKTQTFLGDRVYAELFINPSVSELKEERAVIDPKGNVYVLTTDSYDKILHIDILKFMEKQNIIKGKANGMEHFNKDLDKYLAIVFDSRFTNEWIVGESYARYLDNDKREMELVEKATQYMKLAKKKNPRLKFNPTTRGQ